MASAEENIKVAVRIRPFSDLHKETRTCLAYDQANSVIDVLTTNEPRRYDFNAVFGETATQELIYAKVCEPLVNGFLDGINGTIFAYGQTGSGKTHTMIGPEAADGSFTNEDRGIIPRVLDSLFVSLEQEMEKHGGNFKYSLRCGFAELYNERFYDLLSTDLKTTLQLRMTNIDSVYLQGAEELEINSLSDGMSILKKGWAQRKTAETAMNRESSRSHAVFMLTLETEYHETAFVNRKTSRLNLVDLAGSERQAHTKTTDNDRLREAGNINKSLSILARVIRSLTNKKGNEYISYRDSMLTLLLKDSLGGNARTAVVVNVHPNHKFLEHTLSTLNFAQNVMKVKNKATVNENISCQDVDALKLELVRLKEELKLALAQPKQVVVDETEVEKLKNEVVRLGNMMDQYRTLYSTTAKELATCKNQKTMTQNSVMFLSEQKGIKAEEIFLHIDQLFKEMKPSEPIAACGDAEQLEIHKVANELEKLRSEYKRCNEMKEKLEDENRALSSKLADFMCRTQKKLKNTPVLDEVLETPNDVNSSPKMTDGDRKLRRKTQFSVASKKGDDGKVESDRTLKIKISNLEDKLEDEERSRLEVDMELQQMKQVVADKDALIEKLQSSEDKKMKELMDQLGDLRSTASAAEIENKNLAEECAKLKAERNHLKERVLDDDDCIAKQEAKCSQLMDRLAVLKKEHREATDAMDVLCEEKELLETRLALAGTESAGSKRNSLEVQERLKVQNELDELKIQMKMLEKQKNDLLSENAKMTGHQNHNQKIHYLEKLKGDLATSQKENTALKAKLKRLEGAKGKENTVHSR